MKSRADRALRQAGNIKAGLFLIAIAMIVIILFYTQQLVNRLRDEASFFLHFYASVYAKAASDFSTTDYSFIFQEIIQRIEFPIIISQEKDSKPTAWKNIGIDARDFQPETLIKVEDLMRKMDKAVEPIPLTYENINLGYIHYGDSDLILQLQRLPYIEIGLVALFILIGYVGFSIIRNSEKRNIWVGMAKETAHQLGTPLSSMMGWLEVLREEPENISEIIREISQDVERLKRVSERFSLIGSSPKFQEENLGGIIRDTVQYVERRLPHLGKSIRLLQEGDENLMINLNQELFSWALENVIKNALDAIENESGVIRIHYEKDEKLKMVALDITDTGKGIPRKQWKNIFRPGYSSKERGWGLGLSLTKRIIEEYHHGKLFVLSSQMDKGTTIRILLPCK